LLGQISLADKWICLGRLIMMFSWSWLFVNRLHAGQSPALLEKLRGFWCDGIGYAAICVEAASALKYM
jgi:hypothetical protein